MKNNSTLKIHIRHTHHGLLALFCCLSSMLLLSVSSAQIAQRDAATTGTSTSALVTVSRPTAVAAGAIMIASIANYFDSATHTSASAASCTRITGIKIEREHASLLYKIAAASEPASDTFAATSSSGFSPFMEINNNKVNPNS